MANGFCIHCGQQHQPEALFCPNTGRSLSPAAQGTAPVLPPPSIQSAAHRPPPAPGQPPVPPPNAAIPTPPVAAAPIAAAPAAAAALAMQPIAEPVDEAPEVEPSHATPVGDPADTSAFDWQTILAVLQQAFDIYKKNWQSFLITVAVVLVPISLLKSTLLSALAPSPPHIENMTLEDAMRVLATMRQSWFAATVSGLIGGLLTYAAFLFIQGALSIAVADRMLGGKASPVQAWKAVLARNNRLLSAVIPATVVIVVGMALFVVPGLVAAFLLLFAVQVALFEPYRGTEALKRSYQLVLSDWLRVLVVLVVFGALNWFAQLIGSAITPKYAVFWSTLIGDLITAAILPFPVIGLLLLYFERRKAVDKLTDDQLRTEMEAAIR